MSNGDNIKIVFRFYIYLSSALFIAYIFVTENDLNLNSYHAVFLCCFFNLIYLFADFPLVLVV